MKIIFRDFDGVQNTGHYYKTYKTEKQDINHKY